MYLQEDSPPPHPRERAVDAPVSAAIKMGAPPHPRERAVDAPLFAAIKMGRVAHAAEGVTTTACSRLEPLGLTSAIPVRERPGVLHALACDQARRAHPGARQRDRSSRPVLHRFDRHPRHAAGAAANRQPRAPAAGDICASISRLAAQALPWPRPRPRSAVGPMHRRAPLPRARGRARAPELAGRHRRSRQRAGLNGIATNVALEPVSDVTAASARARPASPGLAGARRRSSVPLADRALLNDAMYTRWAMHLSGSRTRRSTSACRLGAPAARQSRSCQLPLSASQVRSPSPNADQSMLLRAA
jgi:hypothetical protein